MHFLERRASATRSSTFIDLKGLVEEFLEQFGLRGMTYSRRAESTALFLESAAIQLGKLPLGEIGPVAAGAGEAIRFARRGLSG